jgi:hypothetical protein
MGGSQPLPQAALDTMAFVGSQAQPAAEARARTADVLKGVDLNSQQTAAQDSQTILQEQASGVAHSDLVALQASNALMDLTPLLRRLQHNRTFAQPLLQLGHVGTDAQMLLHSTAGLGGTTASSEVHRRADDQASSSTQRRSLRLSLTD